MIVEEVQDSQSGKTLRVKADGQWYSTKEFHLRSAAPGSKLTNYITATSEWKGSTIHWLNAPEGEQIQVAPPSPGSAPSRLGEDPKEGMHKSVRGNVPALIQAGLIKTPDDLTRWTLACREAWLALEHASGKKPAPAAPERVYEPMQAGMGREIGRPIPPETPPHPADALNDEDIPF